MLIKRIATAAVGIPLFLGCVWAGGLLFSLLAAGLALLGFQEFCRMWGQQGLRVPMVSGALACLALVGAAHLGGAAALVPTLTFCGMVLLAGMALGYGHFTSQDLLVALGGVVYIGWLFGHWVLLRALPGGAWLVLFAFLLTWASDTGAYFAGRAFGRHKLAPRVSPGKTVEGAIGGTLLAGAVAWFLGPKLAGVAAPVALLLGLTLSVVAIVGDLTESALKRYTGVKDSGRLLPGHGGVMDRFDSALFTLPVVYYFMVLGWRA